MHVGILLRVISSVLSMYIMSMPRFSFFNHSKCLQRTTNIDNDISCTSI